MDAKKVSRTPLLAMALSRAIAAVILIGCLLFLPAGTMDFWQAWLYLAVLFTPLFVVGIVLVIKDPELLERRMRLRERQAPQKVAIAASTLVLVAVYLIPGLDRRFGWSAVPTALVLLAEVLVFLGYMLFVLTIRENRYASRVVEVQDRQVVISSGPYSLVRHPMYLSSSVMFGLTPLALGSYWALIPALLLPLALALRIDNEEQLLRRELSGYEEYCRRVKYRMIPYVW